ncbi:glucokinase [Acetobacteraceae bacterium]|nr:glucokinase [Acetobacteraceae bacterium]
MSKNQKNFQQGEVVAVDLGGTHARFAIAQISDGHVTKIEEPEIFKCADYDSLASAWKDFSKRLGRPVPRRVAISIACPVTGDILKMTNNPWTIYQSRLAKNLDIDDFIIINDFAAVANAVAHLGDEHFNHLSGPNEPLPSKGNISIVGPGTGLGVALLMRMDRAHYKVVQTEGGHIGYAPEDEIEDKILRIVRKGLCRVSTERIVSGPGLVNIYTALAEIKGVKVEPKIEDRVLWTNAIEGKDELAVEAMERFCLSLGAISGDVALAHGAKALVIAGGVGRRIQNYLEKSGFADRFQAKGRFSDIMKSLPVKIITYPEPGLFGVAAAYAVKKEA